MMSSKVELINNILIKLIVNILELVLESIYSELLTNFEKLEQNDKNG